MAFSGIDRHAGNILRVGYCHDKPWQVSAVRAADNPKLSAFGTITDNMLDAAPSLTYSANGFTLDAKAGSTGNATFNVKYNFPGVKVSNKTCEKALNMLSGLSVGSKIERKLLKGLPTDVTELSCDYKKDFLVASATFNPYSYGWSLSKCCTHDKLPHNSSIAVGGTISGGGMASISSLNYTLGAAYNRMGSKPWSICLKAAPHQDYILGKLTASMHAASEKGHGLATEVVHTLNDSKTQVTLGGLMYLSPKKETWMKAKLTPNARIATVLCHKFSDNLTGSVGCQFAAINEDSHDLSYGMKLALTV